MPHDELPHDELPQDELPQDEIRQGEIGVLRADWPAPARVRSAFTLRGGGVSRPPWDSLNLGIHVGDEPAAVAENRRRVRHALALPAEPLWLAQVHGARVLRADDQDASKAAQHPGAGVPQADAVVTRLARQVCAIQVADCLPVLLAARDGSAVGAAHAGWRGLAGGVIEAAVRAMGKAPEELLAWVGPGIGASHFEVGDEVRAAFVATRGGAGEDAEGTAPGAAEDAARASAAAGAARGAAQAAAAGASEDAAGETAAAGAAPGAAEGTTAAAGAFVANARGRWQCDLRALVRQRLAAAGVHAVYGEPLCTFSDTGRFFSHRRSGPCGRMAALIWLQD